MSKLESFKVHYETLESESFFRHLKQVRIQREKLAKKKVAR